MNTQWFRIAVAALPAASLLMVSPATADTVELSASKDNTLYEDAAGALSNGAGAHCFAGLTGRGELRRTLIAFDLSDVPSAAVIIGVRLRLNMSRTGTGPTPIALHRVLADWGEGPSDAEGDEGLGAPAGLGDATWLHRSHDSSFWTAPGGDFAPQPSAATPVDGIDVYEWASTPELVADVEGWLADPASNFGWCLRGVETTASAKRFDSRQNSEPTVRPVLTIEYSVPCTGDLDGDSAVGLSDLSILLSHFGITQGATPEDGDLDADGDVDLGDLAGMLANFGRQCG